MAVDASAYVSLDAANRALRGRLSRLRAWVRVLLGARLAMMGVAVGAGALVLLHGYERLYGVMHPLEDAVFPLLVGCAAAALVALIWPLPDRLMAASADRRLGLWDRLGTAVGLMGEFYPSGMARAQINDAVRHLSELTPWRAYPLRFDRRAKVMVGCLALLAVVELAPIPPLLLSAREQEEQAELRLVAQEFKPAVEELNEQADEAEDEETDEAAKRLERLTQRMERGSVTKRAALLELAELGDKLDRLDKEIKPPSLKTARVAAQQVGERGREELAKRAEELAERARKQGNRELEKQMREAAEKARKAANASQMRELGAELEQAAAQTGTMLAPAAVLDTVAVAIAGEEWDEALNALGDLQEMLSGDDIELTEEQARELAERMEELAEKLKDTELSELSECLKQAGQCMRQGDCQGAAACLGQGTQAARSGLGAARLGEGVAQMRAAADAAACALRRPASAQSQQSGQCIGPDDGSQQQIPPNAEGSALYAPRETPVDATPEHVRSAVREGGESYASPTRGAPDRVDESRVPYYEVIGDYSRAAEDALEREEVPPAYRGTVRQYFESLESGQTPAGAEPAAGDAGNPGASEEPSDD